MVGDVALLNKYYLKGSKMKKSFVALAVSAGAVAMLASGCRAMMPSVPTKSQSLYSTDAVGYAIKPANANFGDRSIPVYSIGKVKKTATGVGSTVCEAEKNAIIAFCSENKCDYIAAGKSETVIDTVTTGMSRKQSITVKVTGFPVTIIGAKLLKPQYFAKNNKGDYIPLNVSDSHYPVLMNENAFLYTDNRPATFGTMTKPQTENSNVPKQGPRKSLLQTLFGL